MKDGPICDECFVNEAPTIHGRWGDLLDVDAAYSLNLSLDGGGFKLAERPRQLPVPSSNFT
ncbi:MAG: hypothetical protein P8J19_00575 [Acidimicrobiales bacterium]|nr:hypothetical protein [Acidimicrobiales bacterium]